MRCSTGAWLPLSPTAMAPLRATNAANAAGTAARLHSRAASCRLRCTGVTKCILESLRILCTLNVNAKPEPRRHRMLALHRCDKAHEDALAPLYVH